MVDEYQSGKKIGFIIGFEFLLHRSKPDRVVVRKIDKPLPVGKKIKAKKNCPFANFLPDLDRGRALLATIIRFFIGPVCQLFSWHRRISNFQKLKINYFTIWQCCKTIQNPPSLTPCSHLTNPWIT